MALCGQPVLQGTSPERDWSLGSLSPIRCRSNTHEWLSAHWMWLLETYTALKVHEFVNTVSNQDLFWRGPEGGGAQGAGPGTQNYCMLQLKWLYIPSGFHVACCFGVPETDDKISLKERKNKLEE